MREPALAVVGEDDHVATLQQRLEVVQLVGEHFAAGRVLEIDAHQLLLAGDHPQLDRGGHRVVPVQHRVHALGRSERCDTLARFVAAHHRQQRHARTQRGRVAGHIRRAARTFLGARNAHDRHRRLGRDAIDVAEPIAIEHHVADDENAGGVEFRQGHVHEFGGGSIDGRSTVASKHCLTPMPHAMKHQGAPNAPPDGTQCRRGPDRPDRRDCGHRTPRAPGASRADGRNRGCGIPSTP